MWRNLKYVSLLLLLSLHLAATAAEEPLYLEIIVNGTSSGKVLEVLRTDNDWQMTYTDLLDLGLKLDPNLKPATTPDWVALSQLLGTSVEYNLELQQLNLTLPSAMLPLQRLSMRPPLEANPRGERDKGVYINYDLYSLSGQPNARQTSLWHEVYYFHPAYYFSSSGLGQTSNPLNPGSSYTRFESRLQWDNEAELRSVALGDVINATPNWGRSIRMGGIRVARDYELSPNLITYPLPEFYGEAALPGSLSLLINDQLRLRNNIASGPFLIDAMPYISGAGTAQVITTDAQGQETKRELNFYISSALLAPGMYDYDATLGYARQEFGLKSDQYGRRPLFSGSLRYGLNSTMTPQGLLQIGDGLTLAGAGLSLAAGNLGVFEFSHNYSNYRENQGGQEASNPQQTSDSRHFSGAQTGVAYDYTRRGFGINGRYLQRSGAYYDLGNLHDSPQRNSEAQIAASFQRRNLGTFTLGYFRVMDEDQAAVSLVALSWSKFFHSGLSLFVSGNHRLHSQNGKGNAITLSLSLPFGRDSQVGTSSLRDANGEQSNQIQAMRVAPYSGGMGWNLGADDSDARRSYALANWRGSDADVSVGYYTADGEHQYSAELSGALIAMGGDVYTSRTVTDAFAVVDTGQQDIPVLVGNRLIGKTDKQGKLLVPDLYSHLENHISIDPIALPANVTLDSVEKILIPRRKGGLHVAFPVAFSPSAIVSIYAREGEPVPAGAQLQTADGSLEFLAGWNGEIYIEKLDKPITLYWADGQCQVTVLPATDASQALPKLGPFYCQNPEDSP